MAAAGAAWSDVQAAPSQLLAPQASAEFCEMDGLFRETAKPTWHVPPNVLER